MLVPQFVYSFTWVEHLNEVWCLVVKIKAAPMQGYVSCLGESGPFSSKDLRVEQPGFTSGTHLLA